MNSQDSSEMIEVVLGLLEKSKRQDESIQKAIKTLEEEKSRLERFRGDLRNGIIGEVGGVAKIALEAPTEALKAQANNIATVTAQLCAMRDSLTLRNGLWYWGSFLVFMVVTMGFIFWFIPSPDEIFHRKHELDVLTSQLEKIKDISRVQMNTCDKKLCVKVVENQCNWGKKGDRYCVADLK